MITALRRSDLVGALDFVRDAGEAVDLPDFRRRVLDGLPRLVASTMTSYNDISGDGTPVVELDPPDAMTPRRLEAFLRLAGQNPLIAHYAATTDTRPLKISDLMGRRAFRATELYRTVYRPMGAEYQMALPLPAGPGGIAGIALNRDVRDFGERDRAVLTLLRPHIARLRRDAATRESLRMMSALVDRALGDAGRAALAVDRDTRIAYSGAGALAMLGAYLPAGPRADRLPGRMEDWLRRERGRGLRPPADLVADGPSGRLIARLLPAGDREGHDVVLLEEHRVGDGLAAVRGLGLSARQGEVLSLVARGLGNREVAGILGVSPRTVQKHLENIYDRLGVRSRAAATARAVAAARTAFD
jgi:DNA-binding CsgD family transcriptional regulator